MFSYSSISIIVPVYNTEKYLDRCIESIINQTYKELEIILVDDASPDNCPKMCDEWAKKDKRIKVIHIENKGVANARNQGLKIATGSYVGFVDSDDYIEPEMYERLINELNETKCDIAVCGFQVNTEDKGDSFTRIISSDEALKKVVTGDYKFGVLWNKLYKKQVLSGVTMPPLVCCEDMVYNYYAFKNAENIVELNTKLYHYIKNEESTTNKNFNYGAFDAIKSKEIILADCGQNKELTKYAIYGYILSSYAVLNRVISTQKFIELYDELRKGILQFKKYILFSKLYNGRDKIKTLILWLLPKLYGRFFR